MSTGYKFVPNEDVNQEGAVSSIGRSGSFSSSSSADGSSHHPTLELVDSTEGSSSSRANDHALSSSPSYFTNRIDRFEVMDSNNCCCEIQFSSRMWAVFLFSITTILLFADQNLMAPNLTAIADEFHFSNDERDRKLGGDIALAFFLLGAPASFLVGCLADQSNRSVLFAWTVGIGEAACMATWFSRTYLHLYICRAVTGFSLGGALPLIYSILGDLFAAEDRHVVSAIVGMGTGVGIAFGQGVAGFLGPTFGWRLPFLVVSIPALLCAALVLFTVKDPERGGMEKAVLDRRRHESAAVTYAELNEGIDSGSLASSSPVNRRRIRSAISMEAGAKSDAIALSRSEEVVDEYMESIHCGQDWRTHLSTTLSLLATPTVVLTLLQGAPGCVPWGIVNTYLNDFLSEDRGMSVEGATLVVLCFGIGNFFGLVLGGAGGRYLYQLDPRYPPLFAGVMAMLGCVPFWFLLNDIDSTSHVLTIGVITVLGGIGSGGTGPIVKATLQNVTLPTARGQSFAMYTLFDDFGRGLGPVFVAMLIVKSGGRTVAFNIGTLGWMLCGIVNVLMFFTVARDEAMVQATLVSMLADEPVDSRLSEEVAGCTPVVGFV